MDNDCFFNWLSNCMVCHVQMAGEFRIQDNTKLVDICSLWPDGSDNCIIHYKLAELEGGNKESCKGFEV